MTPPTDLARNAALDALARRLGRLGGGAERLEAVPVAPLGAASMDAALPGGGLRFGAVHEVAGSGAAGFTAALLARFAAARQGALLWCQHRRRLHAEGRLYAPGLRQLGVDPARLLMVEAKDDTEVLWVLEEALRSPAITAAVGEVSEVDLFRTRRLQLAAEAGGGAGLLLRPREIGVEPSAAATRWRVWSGARDPRAPPPRPSLAPPRWTAELWRVKGAVPARFEVAFDEQALRFHLAADLADRPLAVGRQQAG